MTRSDRRASLRRCRTRRSGSNSTSARVLRSPRSNSTLATTRPTARAWGMDSPSISRSMCPMTARPGRWWVCDAEVASRSQREVLALLHWALTPGLTPPRGLDTLCTPMDERDIEGTGQAFAESLEELRPPPCGNEAVPPSGSGGGEHGAPRCSASCVQPGGCPLRRLLALGRQRLAGEWSVELPDAAARERHSRQRQWKRCPSLGSVGPPRDGKPPGQ